MVRTIAALAAALVALASSLWCAAPALADSVFGVGGIGEPSLPEEARIRALGGAGAAEHGETDFSFVNPASIARAKHLSLQATLLSTRRWTNTLSYGDGSSYESSFPSIRLVVRLPGSFILGGAYVLGTDADFAVVRPESMGVASELQVTGGGGIQFARATLARRLNKQLNFGIDYEIVGGSYSELWVRRFPEPGFQTSLDTLEISWDRDGRFRFGLNYVAAKGWAVGGVYEMEQSLPVTLTQETSGARTREAGDELVIPSGYTIGFSAPLGGGKRLVGQYQRALWSRSSLQSALVDFRWGERYSIGFERAAPKFSGPSILSKIPIRLGWTYLIWPDLLPLAGSEDISTGTAGVTEWAFSIGTGAATGDRSGIFDASLEYGRRGNLDTLGADESFLRLALSLQITDQTWK